MSATNPLDLDHLRALHANATPGPWTTGTGGLYPWEICIRPDLPMIELSDTDQGTADAALIAAACNALPQLLAEVDRLRAELAARDDLFHQAAQLIASGVPFDDSVQPGQWDAAKRTWFDAFHATQATPAQPAPDSGAPLDA